MVAGPGRLQHKAFRRVVLPAKALGRGVRCIAAGGRLSYAGPGQPEEKILDKFLIPRHSSLQTVFPLVAVCAWQSIVAPVWCGAAPQQIASTEQSPATRLKPHRTPPTEPLPLTATYLLMEAPNASDGPNNRARKGQAVVVAKVKPSRLRTGQVVSPGDRFSCPAR